MLIITLLETFMLTVILNFCTGNGEPKTCLDEYLKGTCVKGRFQNKLNNSNDPIFQLEFVQPNGDRTIDKHKRDYNVYVSSNVASKIIKEVKIIIKGYSTCGDGSFEVNVLDYYHNRTNCGRLLETKRRNFSLNSPYIKWVTPECGCAEFRAIVLSDDVYYSDDENVKNGPLSQRVCIVKGSAENYLNALCSAVFADRDSAGVILYSNYATQNDVGIAKLFNTKLYDILLNRLDAIKKCCIIEDQKSMGVCIMRLRRERIDQLCDHNSTDIQMVNYKANETLKKKPICCKHHGLERSRCFAGPLYEVTPSTYLDYSHDVTNPLNDLAIFGDKNRILDYKVKYVNFETKSTNTDIYEDPFKIGTNKVISGLSKEFQDDKKKQQDEARLGKMCCGQGEKFESTSPVWTRRTNTAEGECAPGAKSFVGQNLMSNVSVCANQFSACCIKKYCCTAGKDYSYKVKSVIRKTVSNECRKGYLGYQKPQKLKSKHREPCKANFRKCCFNQTFINNS